MTKIDIQIRNPRLQQLIAFRRLDRAQLIELASHYFFPTELIDCMSDILEDKLLEILIDNGSDPMWYQQTNVPCNSTAHLKHLFLNKEPNPIYLDDAFMSEYFDRLATPMSDRQLKFYDNLLSKIS